MVFPRKIRDFNADLQSRIPGTILEHVFDLQGVDKFWCLIMGLSPGMVLKEPWKQLD